MRGSSIGFKLMYYVSAQCPVYIMIMLYTFIAWCEDNHNSLFKLAEVAIWLIFSIIAIVLSSVTKNNILKKSNEFKNSYDHIPVKVCFEYNHGLHDFLLSFILPMVSIFSISDHPIATGIMVISFQSLGCIFFLQTSDFFPNITLMVWGYSLFKVEVLDNRDSTISYAFGKTSDVDEILGKEVHVLKLGDNKSISNVSIILKRGSKK